MPNKTQQDLIIGMIIFLLALILAGWGVKIGFPAKEEMPAAAEQIDLSPQIFTTKTAEELKSLDINGPLPITVAKEETGRENPFSGF